MQFRSLAAIAGLAVASTAFAGPATYNEDIDGDLSDDRFNPTAIGLNEGSNVVVMNVVASDAGGDRDYFTVSVGAGQSIDSISIVESSLLAGGFDATAFVGLGGGNFFDFDPDTFAGPGLLGWTLTTPDIFGANSITELTGGPSTLGPGDYTFWVQQTGTDLTQVTLDINLVPAPASLAMLGLGAMATTRRRRS